MFSRTKKAFTIVELVIVIAVIAILAAVLIPTFAAVIKNAEQSTALQACKSVSSEYLSEQMQAKPGKTAKDILGKVYFAYDADGDELELGEYKFRYDVNGQQLCILEQGQQTVGDLDRWEKISGTNVWHKK